MLANNKEMQYQINVGPSSDNSPIILNLYCKPQPVSMPCLIMAKNFAPKTDVLTVPYPFEYQATGAIFKSMKPVNWSPACYDHCQQLITNQFMTVVFCPFFAVL